MTDAGTHNTQVDRALESLKMKRKSYAVIDKGRNESEKSCIWVEEGQFYGMGYLDDEDEIHTVEEMKEKVRRYPGNYYMMQLVTSFAGYYPGKILHLSAPE